MIEWILAILIGLLIMDFLMLSLLDNKLDKILEELKKGKEKK